MGLHRGAYVIVALALGLTPVKSARGDAAEKAGVFFRAGTEAFSRGEFVAAARAFESAHRIAPRGATILNAARSWHTAKHLAEAADDYAAALRLDDLSEADRELATKRLSALHEVLAVVIVSAPAGALLSVGHAREMAIPAEVHLAPGQYKLRIVDASSRPRQRAIEVEAGQRLEVALPGPAESRPDPVAVPRPAAQEPAPGPPTLSYVFLGGALMFAGAASYLGLQALDERDSYDTSGHRDLNARDRAAKFRDWTNVAWGSALLSGALGTTLWLTADPAGQTGMRLAPTQISWLQRF